MISVHNRFTALCQGLRNSFHFFFWLFLLLAPRLVGVPGWQVRPDFSLSDSPPLPAHEACWTTKTLKSALSESYEFLICASSDACCKHAVAFLIKWL